MSQSTPPAPAKPARSPVERAFVWGIIGIGLVVIAIESQAHLSHAAVLGKLQTLLRENSEKNVGITKTDVDKIVGTKTPEQQKLDPFATAVGADRVDIYKYPGLLRERQLFVYYGIAGKSAEQQPEVLIVAAIPAESAAEAQAKLPKADPNAPVAGPPSGMAMPPGGPGGPGGPGSGTGGGGGGGTGGGRGTGGGGGRRGAGRPATEGEAAKSAEAEKKSDDKPATTETPTEEKPAEEKPAEEKKADDKPAADAAQPEAEKPAEPAAKTEAEPKQE